MVNLISMWTRIIFVLIFPISLIRPQTINVESLLSNSSLQKYANSIPPELASYFQAAKPANSNFPPAPALPAGFDSTNPQQQQLAALSGLLSNGNGAAILSQLQQTGIPPSLVQAYLANAGANGASVGLPANIASTGALAVPPASPFSPALPLASPGFSIRPANTPTPTGNGTADRNETESQIAGIPKIYPTLPRAPVPQSPVPSLASQPSQPSLSSLPSLPTRPTVPEGGFGPLASSPPTSFAGGLQPQGSAFLPGSGLQIPAGPNAPPAPTGFAPQGQLGPNFNPPPTNNNNNNLFGSLLSTLGLGGLAPNLNLNSVLGANQQQRGALSNVVSNALGGNTRANPTGVNSTGPLDSVLGNASDIVNNKANVALLQNLLTQPASPLCNPKPEPVDKFNIDAYMGKWFQVLYSPPLSSGPCSMVTYQKLSEVGQGGPGTLFDTFEYATEATPRGQPRVTSGYGTVRGPGQLTYRTTNTASDVNVYVLETGPANDAGQYEYVVLAVNCNYPIHVFARDPIQYKQKYEGDVNAALERRGLVTSFSRLLNLVAPVDYNLCTFPPSLFNVPTRG